MATSAREEWEAKLPKRAQDLINHLRREVERLEAKNAHLADQERYKASKEETDTVVEPYDHDGAVGLMRGAMIEFTPAEDPAIYATTGYHYRCAMRVRNIIDKHGVGWLEVSGDAGLVMETHSSNTYRIRVRP